MNITAGQSNDTAIHGRSHIDGGSLDVIPKSKGEAATILKWWVDNGGAPEGRLDENSSHWNNTNGVWHLHLRKNG